MDKIVSSRLLFALSFLVLCSLACETNRSREARLEHTRLEEFRKALKEVDYDAAKQKEIVERVYSGSLLPDSRGVVNLPPDLASATKYGAAYVTHTEDERLFVLIPTWIGRHTNVRGYLYSQLPLKTSDIHKDTYSGQAEAIDVNVLDRDGARVVEAIVVRVIDDRTLYVWRSLD